MKLYHGSTVTVKKPSLRQGRPNTDYGKGFYTTVDFDQAARWARIRRDRAGVGDAIVSVYEVDDNLLNDGALNIMEYNGATKEWLDFVVANRRFAPLHEYDIVLGPVANDNLYATISLYENGELSAEQMVNRIMDFHDKMIKNPESWKCPKAEQCVDRGEKIKKNIEPDK